MSSPFAITTASNSVSLDAMRHGQAAFTVYNASGRPIRGRARITPETPQAAGWLSLAGAAERDFPIAGTEQVTVHIAVPRDAPPGSYAFRLDMVGVENPDELFTQGPTVAFEVSGAAPKKAFPWWIVLAALGVLLLCSVLAVGGYLVAKNWPTEEPTPPASDMPAPTAVAVVLELNEELSGYFWSSRGGGSRLEQDSPRYRVGVFHMEDLPPAGESTILLSFDIAGLSGAEISEANLKLGPFDVVGNPFAAHGDLLVEEVGYADFLSAPYDKTKPPLNSLFALSRAPTELDVGQALAEAVERGSRRFQLRLRFENVGLEDVSAELAAPDNYVEWDATVIELAVSTLP